MTLEQGLISLLEAARRGIRSAVRILGEESVPRLYHPSTRKPRVPGTPASGAPVFFHPTHGDAVGYHVVAPAVLGTGTSVGVIAEAPQSFEQNPVEAGLVDSPEKYPDSSAH